MDVKGPFGTKPSKRGNRYVLVAIDLFTRVAGIVPIPDKTEKTVASAVIRDGFCVRGIPESLLKPSPHCDTSISIRSGTFDVHKHKHKNMKALRSFLCLCLCSSKVPLLMLMLVSLVRTRLHRPCFEFDNLTLITIAHGLVLSLYHGYIPSTARLVVAPPFAKSEQSASQWVATLFARLKDAHLRGKTRDLHLES